MRRLFQIISILSLLGYVSKDVQEPPSPGFAVAQTAFQGCPACPKMQPLPGGVVTMGPTPYENYVNARPNVSVALRPFAIGVTEATFAQWDACVAGGGCDGYTPPDHGFQGVQRSNQDRALRPVTSISWRHIHSYIDWLNAKTGGCYRLPSEAEWEYAARAGTQTRFWWGNEASREYANYGREISRGPTTGGPDVWEHTAPVASFPANPFGLYDMHGNAAEATADCYRENYTSLPLYGGPSLPCSGLNPGRVMRGGSPLAGSFAMASGYRFFALSGDLFITPEFGFRVAKDIQCHW